MSVLRMALGLASSILFVISIWKFGETTDIRDGIYAIVFLIIANDNYNNAKATKEDN